MNLLKSPIIRIAGIILILYFALFYDNSHPDSLGNRLSKDQIKDNVSQIKDRSSHIITNIKKSQDLKNAEQKTTNANEK